jgi:cytochrome c oxidase subunit 2
VPCARVTAEKETTTNTMPKFSRSNRKLIGVLLLVFLGTLLTACYPDNPQSTFDATGPVARSQLTLFWIIFWAAAFVFVLVEGILVYTIIRYRAKPGDPDPHQTHGNTRLEIGWTVLPAVILIAVAIPTVFTIFDNANSPDPDGGLQVDVLAAQWWWEFTYRDPADSTKDLITANELHIPVDEVININLDSKDVLHSFWIPKIAGKVDVIPNNKNHLWIMGQEIGEFLGQCAEFCGVAHALMRFRVIVESQAEFDAWLESEKQNAIEPIDPLAMQGKAIFEGNQAQCWACHTVKGSQKARGQVGPDLTHVGRRTHIAAGIRENTQQNLRDWITDPDTVKPGNIMATQAQVYNDPNSKLSDAQISALVRYLQGLK